MIFLVAMYREKGTVVPRKGNGCTEKRERLYPQKVPFFGVTTPFLSTFKKAISIYKIL